MFERSTAPWVVNGYATNETALELAVGWFWYGTVGWGTDPSVWMEVEGV
jgi:hypothetical protein